MKLNTSKDAAFACAGEYRSQEGMSKRLYIATQIAASFISSSKLDHNFNPLELIETSFLFADSMIAYEKANPISIQDSSSRSDEPRQGMPEKDLTRQHGSPF
jgi:hypothetical protein